MPLASRSVFVPLVSCFRSCFFFLFFLLATLLSLPALVVSCRLCCESHDSVPCFWVSVPQQEVFEACETGMRDCGRSFCDPLLLSVTGTAWSTEEGKAQNVSHLPWASCAFFEPSLSIWLRKASPGDEGRAGRVRALGTRGVTTGALSIILGLDGQRRRRSRFLLLDQIHHRFT